ncbi:MAG: ferrochelatase [Gammaproteobacteria bacterium]|nr:ferrochelatase [Gammaproteobacteria bacterium]
MKTGFLLLNLGTPEGPDFWSVWQYLRVFLADKRVITLPAPLRYLLLYGLILPTRVIKSSHAYQSIWTPQGSPLRVHGEALCQALQAQLGAQYQIALAMRYGHPSIDSALEQLDDCQQLTILPLYPQYASASTGSSLEAVLKKIAQKRVIPNVTVIREFYDHPGFIKAQADLIAPYVSDHEHLVLSYHGLPQQQIAQSGCHGGCEAACPVSSKGLPDPECYRAQCYQTTALLAEALQLTKDQYTTAFQSRLGRTPWVKPYLEDVLESLAKDKIKRIAIVCPSFVADCLETLEEIGMRGQEFWKNLGGEQLTLIPCLNANDQWRDALITILTNE